MVSTGSSFWLEGQPPKHPPILLMATSDCWLCSLPPPYNNLAGHGPGLRAPTLQVGETEALAKDREQSKSKFEVNIIAPRENDELAGLSHSPSHKPLPCFSLKTRLKLLPAGNTPWRALPAIHPCILSVLLELLLCPARSVLTADS